jgi:hypothetical protein
MKNMSSSLTNGASSFALKVTIVVAAALGGTGLVATNVFAALTATATNTSGGSVTTGTLRLTLSDSAGSGGFTSAITNMGPGDTVNRYIDLTNIGTLDGASPTLQLSAPAANALTTNSSTGLQISIAACSIAWVAGTSTPAATLVASAQSLNLPSSLAGSTNRLKISIALPAGNENVLNGVLPVGTVQGLTSAITWSFTVVERAAITSNS